MTAGFQRHFRNSVHVKFLLGLCPFLIETGKGGIVAAVDNPKRTAYTIIYSLVIIPIYMYMMQLVVLNDDRLDHVSSTMHVIIIIDHLSVVCVYLGILYCSFRNRQQHQRLLNAIAVAYDDIGAQHPASQQHSGGLQRFHSMWNVLQFSFIIGSIGFYIFTMSEYRISNIIYYLLYHLGNLTAVVFVSHVHDIVQLLIDAYSAAIAAISEPNSRDFSVVLLRDIEQCVVQLIECFGVQFIMCLVKDLVLLTDLIFIVSLEWIHLRFPLLYVYYMIVYAMPVLVNAAITAYTFGRLENRVNGMQQAICRYNNEEVSGWDRQIRVCG